MINLKRKFLLKKQTYRFFGAIAKKQYDWRDDPEKNIYRTFEIR